MDEKFNFMIDQMKTLVERFNKFEENANYNRLNQEKAITDNSHLKTRQSSKLFFTCR